MEDMDRAAPSSKPAICRWARLVRIFSSSSSSTSALFAGGSQACGLQPSRPRASAENFSLSGIGGWVPIGAADLCPLHVRLFSGIGIAELRQIFL